eukprot:4880140-Pleurochrysis_carterae.AAC.1
MMHVHASVKAVCAGEAIKVVGMGASDVDKDVQSSSVADCEKSDGVVEHSDVGGDVQDSDVRRFGCGS